ncbi:helix-turn-helix domain-containing protein [Sphingobium sp. CCH11-B1]|jgi:predicted transcriptional regulator/DNA-binding XRE family transcriptional regulator|uniref:helix-turn-helix domain-containing protein n=1 Tax=Sphingobium sp. CCH11-B1 TaxID=1768781 RepID=UPI0008338BD1|nr:XRE family transcriptional regulator [Sphingobium sp. CCH11-B1]MEA3388180.1 short-chain fatty acyl-CoA regulator family protein [Pseudomonadota bacterium]
MADVTDRKLYLGPRLRVLRRELGLNQTRMAEELGVSPSYLNHLERNQRPLTAQMLLRLANTYDIDIRDFTASPADGSAGDLGEILSDPLVRDIGIARDEVLDVAENYPGVGEAIARFYRALTDLRRVPGEAVAGGTQPLLVAPLDWLRETIAKAGNHFADIDAAAEAIAAELPDDPAMLQAALRQRLKDRHGMAVQVMRADVLAGSLRHYDMHRRRLMLSERLAASGRLFAVAYHLCAQELADAIAAQIARAAPPDEDSRRLFQIALMNHAAAALIMPYDRFRQAAEQSRYDIPLLIDRFGASAEQVAHRLTSLHRTGARGIPFFLVKLDRAGILSKRFDGEAYPFARYGGTCPRWDAHAPHGPGEMRRQLIETLDGRRFLTLSIGLPRGDARAGSVVALGCEAKHAGRVVHADGIDVERDEAVGVGPTCALCERRDCPDRALPPVTRALDLHSYERTAAPFPFRRV